MPRFAPMHERILIFVALYAFWAIAYFGVAALNAGRPAYALEEDAIGLIPRLSVFVVPYFSAYALPILLLVTMREEKKWRRLALVVVGVIAASAAAFMIVPLTIVRPPIADASLSGRLLGALYAVDAPTNLFPSLHVSLSSLFALAVAKERPHWKCRLLAWAALIAVSTLFIRQHYVIDVLAGALLAWIAWRIFLRSRA